MIEHDGGNESENALDYKFMCNENIKSFTIVSNREINYFNTEVPVFVGEAQDVSPTEAFTCEGVIPGNGIGCYTLAQATQGNTVKGTIGLTEELCEAYVQPRFWVIVQSTQYKGAVAYQLTSEPFPLAVKCDTLNAKKKAKEKALKLCAKVKTAKPGKSRDAARKRCKAALAEKAALATA